MAQLQTLGLLPCAGQKGSLDHHYKKAEQKPKIKKMDNEEQEINDRIMTLTQQEAEKILKYIDSVFAEKEVRKEIARREGRPYEELPTLKQLKEHLDEKEKIRPSE